MKLEKVKIKKEEKLSLTNSGNLSLFFVGTGSAFSKMHYQTNLLIIKGDSHVLVDCGSLCPIALWEYGCPVMNIETFLITHSHADHIGGLEEAMLMGRYVKKRKPGIIIPFEYRDILWENSLKGGSAYNERHGDRILTFYDMFNYIEPVKLFEKPRYVWEVTVGPINLKIFRTAHIPDNSATWEDSFLSYGVLIDEKVLFTSDTKFDRDLLDTFCERWPVEYIFHDCQLFPGGVHASYGELSKLPDEFKSKMYLSHYGDNYKDFNPMMDGFLGFVEQGAYYNLVK